MPSIYLIRHGQASFGQENYDQLSDLGQQQATRVGEVLSQRLPEFDKVCLGSMLRHKQTATNCMAAFGKSFDELDAHIDSGWNEYDHQDILRQFRPEFETAASLNAYIREQANPKQAFEDDFNGAIARWMSGEHDSDYVESWQAFSSRVHGAFKATIESSSDAKSIAVFTSGGPISLVSQHVLGVPVERIMHMNWTLLNCGVSKFVVTSSRVFLASLNEHTHFEDPEYKSYLTYS